jgi:hypothetical protein
MNIPVFVEPIENDGFRATGGPGLDFVSEGATLDEALGRFRAEIERRIAAAAVLVNLEVGTTDENPWVQCAGSLKDDPLFDAWQQEIVDYRREIDESPDDL